MCLLSFFCGYCSYVQQFSDAGDILDHLKKPKSPVPKAKIVHKYPKLQALMQRRAEEKAKMEEELARAQALEAERKKEEETRAALEAAEAKAREQLEEEKLAQDTDHEVSPRRLSVVVCYYSCRVCVTIQFQRARSMPIPVSCTSCLSL